MYSGRIAPSPTGLLHLGHARTFWTAFERARAAHGKLWLRDENLDTQRSRVEFSIAMKEDLRWFGIAWDDELRQSDRISLYQNALQSLVATGLAYSCLCSRRDLAPSIAAPHEDDEPVYSGRCRPTEDGRRVLPFVPNANYRLRVPNGLRVNFTDLQAGPQTFTAGIDFGDFLIWRKDGLPSYQFACVIDDAAMDITEVVRGRDLLKSTARQMLLQRALTLPTPSYFHCDLLRDASGVRLAKRHDALSLRSLREQGLSPAQVRAMF